MKLRISGVLAIAAVKSHRCWMPIHRSGRPVDSLRSMLLTFAQVKWLWEVVIWAHFEADDAVSGLAASAQDNDPTGEFSRNQRARVSPSSSGS